MKKRICPETGSECTSRGLKLHDSYPEFNSAYEPCSFSPREVHSVAVSGHFYIYLGLGTYGHGVCLHSLHVRCFLRGLVRRCSWSVGSHGVETASRITVDVGMLDAARPIDTRRI